MRARCDGAVTDGVQQAAVDPIDQVGRRFDFDEVLGRMVFALYTEYMEIWDEL